MWQAAYSDSYIVDLEFNARDSTFDFIYLFQRRGRQTSNFILSDDLFDKPRLHAFNRKSYPSELLIQKKTPDYRGQNPTQLVEGAHPKTL